MRTKGAQALPAGQHHSHNLKDKESVRTDAKCLAGENAEDLGGGHVGRGDRDGREHGGDHHAWQQ